MAPTRFSPAIKKTSYNPSSVSWARVMVNIKDLPEGARLSRIVIGFSRKLSGSTDNEEAEIVVADNIPFLTRQDETDADRTFSNYEFKDVGVTLRITPQINQERLVRLKIEQELSQVVEQEEVGLPTTLQRKAKTTVVIKDGQTVVYGGLIDETLTQSDYQVPCLGGIKGIGWLFKSKSSSGDRTNLYVFITPHIIENPMEAQEVYQEKREEVDRVREGVIKMYEGRPKSE